MTDTRQAFIDGLHQIADFLAEHPEVPLPHLGSYIDNTYAPVLTIWLHGGREDLSEVARAMGKAQKTVNNDTGEFKVYREFAGIKLVASADRDAVCERVVTGTREVTEEVPDPEALAAVPKVAVTKVVEDVEWRCGSLLKPAGDALQFVTVPS